MGKCGRKIFRRLTSGILSFLLLSVPALAECELGFVKIRGEFGNARFRVEVADDAAERAEGLMFREHLPASAGMLFVYEKPQSVSFWMRNTLIPLDMIFVDAAGKIAKIYENAVPLDETPIPGGDDIFAVLEINGGLSRRIGLAEGNVLQHPAFSQSISLWPCD